MAQYSPTLDSLFDALADPTRRAVVHRLGKGPASVGDLASDFTMALPSFLRHIRALEGSGLISTRKTGRVRTCTLETDRLEVLDGWLAEQRAIWESRTDRLEKHVRQRKDDQ
jgi:DNA-binding transcriptional ArsR family regulator